MMPMIMMIITIMMIIITMMIMIKMMIIGAHILLMKAGSDDHSLVDRLLLCGAGTTLSYDHMII